MNIDVCTTAMPRPEIVDRTYRSFIENTNNIQWGDCYINVDPLPGKEGIDWPDRMEVVEVAKKYFQNVYHRFPDIPSYADAFNFVWSNAKSEIILNLEDDWELVRPLDFNTIGGYFRANQNIYEVILRAYTYKYLCLVTSPSFLSRHFYHKIGGKLYKDHNPEWQIHHRQDMGLFIPNSKNCINPGRFFQVFPFVEKSENHVIVKDMGRAWMERTKYVRPQMLNRRDKRYTKKVYFTKWLVK